MCVYTYICVCKPHCVFSVTQSCLTIHCPMDYSLPGCPWNFPGKNTGVGCHFLLQGIFLTQGSNPHLLCLLHWQVDSLLLMPAGKPINHIIPSQLLKNFVKCNQENKVDNLDNTWLENHLNFCEFIFVPYEIKLHTHTHTFTHALFTMLHKRIILKRLPSPIDYKGADGRVLKSVSYSSLC